MNRTIPSWTAAPLAAVAFVVAVSATHDVIESITVAALATICWSFVFRIVRSLGAEEGGSDGPRD